MAAVWSDGRRKAVFHRIGNHANGAPKYRRANYDILFRDFDGDGIEEQYVITPAADLINGTEINEAGQEHEIGTLAGFYEIEPEIIDVSNPGGSSGTESWYGLHSFGYY